jgi:ABC-type branched-subunit amino acid transport system substrate-binding protein
MRRLIPPSFPSRTGLLAALAAAVALAVGGCATQSKHRSKDKDKEDKDKAQAAAHKKVKTAKPLSDEELADDEPVAPPKKPKATMSLGAKAAPKGATLATTFGAPGPTADQVAACQAMASSYVESFRRLYQTMPPGVYVPTGLPLDQVVASTPVACNQDPSRGALVAAVNDGLNTHTGRIGVILPLTGPRAKLATYVVNGLRAAMTEAGLSFDKMVVLKDSGGNPQLADERLAELIFRDRVALVVGGMERPEAESLGKWSAALAIPVVLLNRDRDLNAPSKFAFTLYPDEKRLAETLAAAATKRGWHRFAVLKPSSGKSDKVVDYFHKAVQAKGGQVAYDLAYTPMNFDSMQGVSAQLVKANASDRADEYRKAYMKAKADAAKEGVPFDQRMVVLKPIVDFDAVFIPDDFRVVRHFAKLFKYHMVDHLPMIGNHEWRSPALIDPYDEFLDGSLFADFIGSYAKLPPQVGAPTAGSPYFVEPQSVVAVDFQLIGYRAGRVARAATQNPRVGRRQIPDALAAITADAAGFFGKGAAFDGDRHSNWPTYLFTVTKKSLSLDGDASAAMSGGGGSGMAPRRECGASPDKP